MFMLNYVLIMLNYVYVYSGELCLIYIFCALTLFNFMYCCDVKCSISCAQHQIVWAQIDCRCGSNGTKTFLGPAKMSILPLDTGVKPIHIHCGRPHPL